MLKMFPKVNVRFNAAQTVSQSERLYRPTGAIIYYLE